MYLGFEADPSLNIVSRIRGPNVSFFHILSITLSDSIDCFSFPTDYDLFGIMLKFFINLHKFLFVDVFYFLCASSLLIRDSNDQALSDISKQLGEIVLVAARWVFKCRTSM